MRVQCPKLANVAIVSDDAKLAAALSCAIAISGTYLPVLDGPRTGRPDLDAEVIRRNNALARAGVTGTILADLTPEADALMRAKLPAKTTSGASWDAIPRLLIDPKRAQRPAMQWGNDRSGAGMLKSFYAGRLIEFGEGHSPVEPVLRPCLPA